MIKKLFKTLLLLSCILSIAMADEEIEDDEETEP